MKYKFYLYICIVIERKNILSGYKLIMVAYSYFNKQKL